MSKRRKSPKKKCTSGKKSVKRKLRLVEGVLKEGMFSDDAIVAHVRNLSTGTVEKCLLSDLRPRREIMDIFDQIDNKLEALTNDIEEKQSSMDILQKYISSKKKERQEIKGEKKRIPEILIELLGPGRELQCALSYLFWERTDISHKSILDACAEKKLAFTLVPISKGKCIHCGDPVLLRKRYERRGRCKTYCDKCLSIINQKQEEEWKRQSEAASQKRQQQHYQQYQTPYVDPNVRLRELRSLPYKEYLQTDEWKETRRAALQRAVYRCQLCGQDNRTLDVHHNTYRNLGNEQPEDLVVLCRDCHSIHERKGETWERLVEEVKGSGGTK